MPSITVPLLSLFLFLATASASIPLLNGYKVVWSDDFNGAKGAAVDQSKWVQKVGPGSASNGELETYTAGTGNVHLSGDGQLYIIPTHVDGKWYSGRLESNTAQSADTGGAMIVQAEVWVPNFTGSPAKFAGLWPAFWTKGNDFRSSGVPWPRCGEWDILEVIDGLGDRNQGTLHFEDANGNHNGQFHSQVTYAGGQYHTWAIKVDLRNGDWTQQKLTWFLDGTQFYQVTGAMVGTFEQWVELAWRDYYVILQMAVGGGYPGNPTAQTVSGFDSSMRVKYVAIYKTV
ncbi:glycoside hydrolase family 16 protein [Mycena vitilis]|nr:glycoside hydrolase family 16 protein [Mycena vitilis]